MALSAWQATIVNESGDVIPSASIEVVDEATGLTATIFANAGGGSLGNPFSAGTNGFARFYAAAGSYTITASDAGSGFSESFNNVRLGNAQGYDVGTGSDQVPLNSDLGTASTKNTGLASGQIPTADQLSMVGETVNYTGVNYQPNVFGGIGVVVLMKNLSGATINKNTTVSGIVLRGTYLDATGTAQGGIAPAGTVWRNVSGLNLGVNLHGPFVREL